MSTPLRVDCPTVDDIPPVVQLLAWATTERHVVLQFPPAALGAPASKRDLIDRLSAALPRPPGVRLPGRGRPGVRDRPLGTTHRGSAGECRAPARRPPRKPAGVRRPRPAAGPSAWRPARPAAGGRVAWAAAWFFRPFLSVTTVWPTRAGLAVRLPRPSVCLLQSPSRSGGRGPARVQGGVRRTRPLLLRLVRPDDPGGGTTRGPDAGRLPRAVTGVRSARPGRPPPGRDRRVGRRLGRGRRRPSPA